MNGTGVSVDRVSKNAPVTALRSDVLVERVPVHTLNDVGVLAQREYTFTLSSAPASLLYTPVDAFQIVAVLSVEPAMKNSPSGDHARSMTCLLVTWSIFCGRQCSLSGTSSGVSPKDTVGRSDGTQRMTLPSAVSVQIRECI